MLDVVWKKTNPWNGRVVLGPQRASSVFLFCPVASDRPVSLKFENGRKITGSSRVNKTNRFEVSQPLMHMQLVMRPAIVSCVS